MVRFVTAAAGGARRADGARGRCAGVVGYWPGTCWSRSTGCCPVPARCWWCWPPDSARCGCRGGGRRTVCCRPRSRCAATLAAVAVLPSAWVLAEAVRSWHRLGGPWALLGASQWNQPATLVSASLGGVWLTSFLLVATNTAVAGVVLHRGVARRVITLAVALACAGLGPAWFVLGPAPPVGPTVRVALVQPGDISDSAARQAASESSPRLWRASIRTWSSGVRAASVSTSAATPVRHGALADLSRRVGADLLVNVERTLAERGNLQVVRPHRTERVTAARTRKPGWCPSASTCPYARCSAGSPAPPRPQPKTGDAGVGQVVLHTGLDRHRAADQL